MSEAETINIEAKGITQKFVGLGYSRKFPIFIPSLITQKQIVQKLDALQAETKKLEAVYQKKIEDLEELKKSVLQKAFREELTSPEGTPYTNDGHSPSKKTKTKSSPERA